VTAAVAERTSGRPAATLAGYSDDELAEWFGASTDEHWHAVLLAEMDRRDQAERGRRDARQDSREEWHRMAHAQWLQAERECCGVLVNARGRAAGIDPFSLWSGPEHRAEIYASEELREWWRTHGRIDITTWQRQAAGERRAWIEERDRGDQLANHAAGSVRHERAAASAAVTVPGAGPVRDAGHGRPDRPGRGSEGTMSIGSMAAHGLERAGREAIRAGARQATYRPSRTTTQLRQRADAIRAGRDLAGSGSVAVRERTAVAARTPQIDGGMVLDLTRAYIQHYVALPSPAAAATVTAWVAHAVARDRDDTGIGPLIWRASPRLLVTSRNRGSGKSTLLDLIAILTRSRNGKMPKVTPRAIAEVLGSWYETAVLDEAKLIFGAGRASQELQGILLAGYTPRASYAIKGRVLPLFGSVCYAGKDELITDTNGQLGDLLDRTITIRMRPPSRPVPEVDEQAEDEGDLLAAALIAWTDSARAELRQAARDIAAEDRESAEEGNSLRSAQIWRPLRAIGRVAGGSWPEEMDAAAQQLTAGAAGTETADLMAELQRMAQGWSAPAEEDGVILQDDQEDEDAGW
jgi:Protein of unknown function (DUF3631)